MQFWCADTHYSPQKNISIGNQVWRKPTLITTSDIQWHLTYFGDTRWKSRTRGLGSDRVYYSFSDLKRKCVSSDWTRQSILFYITRESHFVKFLVRFSSLNLKPTVRNNWQFSSPLLGSNKEFPGFRRQYTPISNGRMCLLRHNLPFNTFQSNEAFWIEYI